MAWYQSSYTLFWQKKVQIALAHHAILWTIFFMRPKMFCFETFVFMLNRKP